MVKDRVFPKIYIKNYRWKWYTPFSGFSESLLYISDNQADAVGFDVIDLYADTGVKNVNLLLCEEYFEIPFGVLVTGIKYACDDKIQRLAHQRYSNQGGNLCYYQDYVVTCDASLMNNLQYVGKYKVSTFLFELNNCCHRLS